MAADKKSGNRRKKPHTWLLMVMAALGGGLVLLISALLNTPTGGGGSGIGGPGRQGSSPATPPVFQSRLCLWAVRGNWFNLLLLSFPSDPG